MDDINFLNKENLKMDHYNLLAGGETKDLIMNDELQDNTHEWHDQFSYRTLNSRYINLEKTFDNNAFLKHEMTRKTNKKKIENEWHKSTDSETKDLLKKKGDRTKPEYYASFSLAQLETLLKNNDKGGNSDLFNNVVTDLELYNRAREGVNSEEVISLSLRLAESCDKYTKKRSPLFKQGKIRKAIILQVKQQLQYTKDSLKNSAKESMEKFNIKSNVKEEKVQKLSNATKANYDLISQYLQGTLVLSKDEIMQLDDNMNVLFNEMYSSEDYQVDVNQNKDLNTRFFNAIGWTSRKPKLVEPNNLSNESAKGPFPGIQLFHTICDIEDKKKKIPSATTMAKQLMGGEKKNNRHYMSDGYMGKGSYLASIKRSEKDKLNVEIAMNDSWHYGTTFDSVQLTMSFNENTRIIKQSDLEKLIPVLEKNFPKLLEFIKNNVLCGNRPGNPWLSIVGALFGYNATISTKEEADKPCDYYVAYDRSALSICSNIKIATQSGAKEPGENYMDDSSYNIETVEFNNEKEDQ